MTPEIFYLVGALRDGCLTTDWTVKYKQKNRDWLSNVILPMINRNFKLGLTEKCIYLQEEKTTVWYIAFKKKDVWKKLSYLRTVSPRTQEQQKLYIRGFWDADGGCPKNPSEDRKIYIKFTQKDRQSLEEIKETLNRTFQIKTGVVRISEIGKNGPIWRFTITSKDGITKFCRKIGSFHPEKKNRLTKIEGLLLARQRERAAGSPPLFTNKH
ncbi:hypothetical protein A3K63_03915 [Candidatus Micrarchaeota archaeon RBG_16_49_10]|nr:MAG: hypothetical protein A3K63_03915 [Candidatus Micrarchaeota archaeon RBG_16_49_10]